MSANDEDYTFDEYDKPGTERSRRRRGEDDDLESDLEEDLLEEFSPSGKKNLSEDEDEELNDALLQSDEEEHMSGQEVSLNATYGFNYSDDAVNLGADDYDDASAEPGYPRDRDDYSDDYARDMVAEEQVDYAADEVLDIQITEPIDGEFQDNEYQTYEDEEGVEQEVAPEEETLGDEQQAEAEGSQLFERQEVGSEAMPEEAPKEDSDDDEEDDGDSGRIRFKSERKDAVVVRLADAGTKRRNIPETLELSEKAKRDLIELEQQERYKRQNRYGGRGGRGGGGYAGFGMHNVRGGHRGRMNEHNFHPRGNMRSSRMPLLHFPHQQQQQQPPPPPHHPLSRPRGPHPFQERLHGHRPLQPLITTHRSPLQPQMDAPPRLLGSPPATFGHQHDQQQQHHHHHHHHHHQQQLAHPKNIHINPHFRGSAPSTGPVPLMPPAPSQPRPALGPQRFPAPGDFHHQQMANNFGQPQRPPHHMEPFRNQPRQGPPDREPLFMGGPERADPTSFPGQLMFDPNPLLNASLHQQQMPAQGHMSFGAPAFGQRGPLGLFSREPPRPGLPPPQGHQGLVSLNQPAPPPNQSRPFLNPRQPFSQQGGLFPPPQAQFGMQGLIPGPPQPPIQDSLPSHQPIHQQHHRQELLHHHHHQQQQQQHHQQQQQQQRLNLNEPPRLLHHGQNLFQQQQLSHSGPRQASPRLQNVQQRNMANRQRMTAPASKQIHPQRNSNLRELPVAPGNATVASLGANVRPVTKATQGVRPVQRAHALLPGGGGRGRGQVADNNASPQPAAAPGRTVICKESPSSAEAQDEDEETRQYRLKIEEQKRLREEILRRKELRRQMQAGVRKKELLDRISTPAPTQSQAPSQQEKQPAAPPPQVLLLPPSQQQQQQQPPSQQPPPQQQPPPPEQRQPPPLQQQRPPRPQQPFNQSLGNPNGAAPRPNVKSRLQMGTANNQQPQTLRPGPEQQWRQPPPQSPLLQQRRTSGPLNVNKAGAPDQLAQIPLKNIPALGPGQPQAQGLKPGAKRTVMQRAKLADGEGQQLPQKVRVVKLSGAPGKGPEATAFPMQQQPPPQPPPPGPWPDNPFRQSIQRKVTMAGQQVHGAGGMQHLGPGGMGYPQQNRVVVSGRGRGGAPAGRGGPAGARQGQRVGESLRRTVTIEGLSSSTTDVQLQSLLRSIGPIEMFQMIPQQRKAIAVFSSPQHAASFQMSFHRHMIDLSHIDVKLID
ncbi:RNA-binding protein 33 isoform X2 [Syngnathus typhle]|uniref:RNA-binding protein 33 isoform X2 n=1 Tax=Syngnathus typhle TaxID=161592 RepID=UPI002A69F04B|nr:RNA-binding protein 33 isoform X2 [Syngnathus typhle]